MSMLITAVSAGVGTGVGQLPNMALIGLDLFIRVHKLWYWKNLYDDVTSSKENFLSFGVSYGLNGSLGKALVERIGLDPPYRLFSRLLFTLVWYEKSIEQYKITVHAYENFLKTCRGEKIVHVRSSDYILPEKKFTHYILDPAFQQRVVVKTLLFIVRIEHSAKMGFQFLREAYELSNCIVTFGETLSFAPETGDHAKDLCTYNAWKILSHMPKDSKKLIEALDERKKMFQKLNKNLPIFKLNPKDLEASFEAAKKLIESTDKVISVVSKKLKPVFEMPVISHTIAVWSFLGNTLNKARHDMREYACKIIADAKDSLAPDFPKEDPYAILLELKPMRMTQPRPKAGPATSLRDIQLRARNVMQEMKWRLTLEKSSTSHRVQRLVLPVELLKN